MSRRSAQEGRPLSNGGAAAGIVDLRADDRPGKIGIEFDDSIQQPEATNATGGRPRQHADMPCTGTPSTRPAAGGR
jgi:hypothetical protein